LRDNKAQLMTVANEASKIALRIITLYNALPLSAKHMDKLWNEYAASI
jgi:hypothetical protein